MENKNIKKCIICGTMIMVVGIINNPCCEKCKAIFKEPDLPVEMSAHEQLYKPIAIYGTSISVSGVNTLDDN